MLQHVLGEGRTVAQLPQQTDDLGMDAVDPGIERGLFAHFAHLGIQFLFAFLDDVLDAGGWMRPSWIRRSRAILAT